MLESPQNKINVEFQPSKKMKKRRELDALVCNGKVRRKSKSGHELLRTESESSEIDEFSIAAQKTLFRNRGKSSCSSCKTVIGFLLLGICLILCAGLIWLHFDMKNSIQILTDKIHTVETKNTDSSIEIGTFKKQIEDLKKLVGNSDTKDLTKFTDLDKKVDDLKKATETLKSAMSVTSKQELDKKLEQLTQIPVISQTVAKIGSDVENLKSKIEELNTFKQDTTKKIDELNQKTGQSGDRESKPLTTADLSQKYDMLQQTLGDLNLTMLTKVHSLETLFSVHQIKFNKLENQTAQLQVQMSQGNRLHPATGLFMPDNIQKQIEDKVEDTFKLMLANKTDDISEASLNSILSNMDNVTSMVRDLKDQFVKLKTDHSDMLNPETSDKGDHSEMTEFKTTATERLDALNKTMGRVSHDVSVLMHQFILNQNSLTSLTRIVEGIRHYIVILENKIGVPDNKTNDDSELAKIIKAENISIPLDIEKNSTEPTPAPITTTPRPVIHMTLIHNVSEAELGLHRWDKNGDGVLNSDEIETLQDYMPDPPPAEKLKMFDFDQTGTIDKDELMIALGFSPYPSEKARQRLADLG